MYGTGRKKSNECDLEKEDKLDRSYTQRQKPAQGDDRQIEGRMIEKRPRGRKRLDMLNEFLQN